MIVNWPSMASRTAIRRTKEHHHPLLATQAAKSITVLLKYSSSASHHWCHQIADWWRTPLRVPHAQKNPKAVEASMIISRLAKRHRQACHLISDKTNVNSIQPIMITLISFNHILMLQGAGKAPQPLLLSSHPCQTQS